MTVDEVPNPQATAGRYVQDSAQVLGSDYVALIDSLARELAAKTTAELAVVTIDNLGGTTVEDFAERLFQRFGIGKNKIDNGILILFALQDRRVRIEVGYGLEGTLTDAESSRLLEVHAIPRFKAGAYARGLYELTKAVATRVADSSGAKLSFTDPAAWPDQVTPPAPVETAVVSRPEPTPSGMPLVFYLLGVAGLLIFSFGLQALRIGLPKAKAAKQRALGGGAVFPSVLWSSGLIGIIVIGGLLNQFLLPVVAFAGASGLATYLHVLLRKRFRRYIASYRLDCPQCKKPAQLVSESADDQFLTAEEIAEEKAGGMDYEFWDCPACDHRERLEVKLPGADKCPRCRRRTLTSETTVLRAATYDSSGLEKVDFTCHNPKCGHKYSQKRTIPRKSRPSSGGSSFGSSGGFSGGGSFGGGRSGGGGASGGW